MPLWITEQEALEDEGWRIEAGAPPRDMSERSKWRERTDVDIQRALAFYGTYLVGQTNGLSDALSLSAFAVACDLDGVSADDRAEVWRRMTIIHSAAVQVAKARQRPVHG